MVIAMGLRIAPFPVVASLRSGTCKGAEWIPRIPSQAAVETTWPMVGLGPASIAGYCRLWLGAMADINRVASASAVP